MTTVLGEGNLRILNNQTPLEKVPFFCTLLGWRHLYIYIYIYIKERERERRSELVSEREKDIDE